MSRSLLESFFPAHTSILRAISSSGFGLYDRFLSDRIAEKCPVRHVDLGITVRWPGLVIPAAIGILIGFRGATLLFRRDTPRDSLWAWAFFWFGMMNIDAFFYHCLLPEGSMAHSLMWCCDCWFTGNSSTTLVFASLYQASLDASHIKFEPAWTRRELVSLRLRPKLRCVVRSLGEAMLVWLAVYEVLLGPRQSEYFAIAREDDSLRQRWIELQLGKNTLRVATMSWLAFLLFGMLSWAVFDRTVAWEIVYLFPTGIACFAMATYHIVVPLVVRWTSPSRVLTAAGGIAVLLSSTFFFDGHLCDMLGAMFGNIPVSTFLACDVGFLGILMWVVTSADEMEGKED